MFSDKHIEQDQQKGTSKSYIHWLHWILAKLKAYTYFVVLFISMVAGYFLIDKVIGSITSDLLGFSKSNIPIFIHKLFHYISLSFSLLLIFRAYICISNKKIILPEGYSGIAYFFGSLVAWSMTVVIGFYILFYIHGAKGVSGIPLVFAFIPTGFISVIIALRYEIPSIIKYFKKSK